MQGRNGTQSWLPLSGSARRQCPGAAARTCATMSVRRSQISQFGHVISRQALGQRKGVEGGVDLSRGGGADQGGGGPRMKQGERDREGRRGALGGAGPARRGSSSSSLSRPSAPSAYFPLSAPPASAADGISDAPAAARAASIAGSSTQSVRARL